MESRIVPDWRDYVEGERMGPEDAAVTIVEFSDFQCPFCRGMAERIGEIRRMHPENVALVYRHFPLAHHSHAALAARASVCAGRQNRFEPYHDALFAAQDSLGLIPWVRLAEAAGVPDTTAFSSCLSEGGPLPEIERDLRAGARLGVQGTPALLVNDRFVVGAAPGLLEELVSNALRESAGR